MGFVRDRLPDPETYYKNQNLPGFHRSKDGQFRAVCPFHTDAKNKNSLLLDTEKGSYKCFACGAYGRNVLDFEIAQAGADFKTAARNLGAWLEELPLDLPSPSPETAGRPQAEKAPSKRPQEDAAAKAVRLLAYCLKIWNEAKPIQTGDPVALYLAERGLQLDAYPDALRYHQALTYRDDDKTLGQFPAMLAAITNRAGEIIGIHRTYIGLPGDLPRKKIVGKAAGAAVRLATAPGAGPYGPRKGAAEGIETALSATQLYGVPVDSALSADGLEAYDVDGLAELWIFADQDDNDRGRDAAHELASRAIDAGLAVRAFYPGEGLNDFNDQIRAP